MRLEMVYERHFCKKMFIAFLFLIEIINHKKSLLKRSFDI